MLELALALLLAAEEPSPPAAPPAPAVTGPAVPDLRAAEPASPRAPTAPAAAREEPAKRGAGSGESPSPSPSPSPAPAPEPRGAPRASGSRGPATLEQSAEALTRAQSASEGTLPPSLTGRALAEELKRSARERTSDRAAVQSDRIRLEALAKEIAAARAALREETAKLEALASAQGGKPGQGQGSQTIESLARTVKGMKPAEAAAVLTRVDRPLAAVILERMRPADAALVIGKMEPTTGAEVFRLLARADAGRKP